MLKTVPMIYKVDIIKVFEKPYYFITKRDIYDFECYLKTHVDNWLCYEWYGYINPIEHKVVNDGGYTRYWRDGSTTNR